ncbi:MAG: hypothetical protein LBL16_01005 [Endomicrobium sp.]|jgi:SulP family sulfate permease|nr:hypothetical protein [Endomicrobium sp.]
MLTTFALTVFVDLVYAIEIGMVLAAFLFMKRMADIANIDTSSDNAYEGIDEDEIENKKNMKGVVLYEINGPFFFNVRLRILVLFFAKYKNSH